MATKTPDPKTTPKTTYKDRKDYEKEQPSPGDPGAPIIEPRTPQGPRPEGVPLEGDPPIGY
jgi:hypothetical protein